MNLVIEKVEKVERTFLGVKHEKLEFNWQVFSGISKYQNVLRLYQKMYQKRVYMYRVRKS